MAAIKLEAPGWFKFKKPELCTRWKQRFEQYRIAFGLDKEDGPRQVCVLLYCMGVDAEHVLTSTTATADDRKEFSKVMDKLGKFFKLRQNVTLKRATGA